MKFQNIKWSLIIVTGLLATTACDRGGRLTLEGTSLSDPPVAEIAAQPVDAGSSDSKSDDVVPVIEGKSDADPKTPVEKPIDSKIPIAPVTVEVEAPKVSPIDPGAATGITALQAKHRAYAAYTGASEMGVKMIYEENFSKGPVNLAKNIASLNQFLDFAYRVDPVIRKGLEQAKEENERAHDAINSSSLSNFLSAANYLAADFEIHVIPRLVKAGEIYGINISAHPNTEGLTETSYLTARENFLQDIAARLVLESSADPEFVKATHRLMASVTLNYSTGKMSGGQVAVASFFGKSKLVGFADKQGGYGYTAIDDVSFVSSKEDAPISYTAATEYRADLKGPEYTMTPVSEYSEKI